MVAKMTYKPRAITVRSSVAFITSSPGPLYPHYELPLTIGVPFQWIVDDSSDTDDITVLGASGGGNGRWHRLRQPIKGTDLTDADESIGVGGNYWRRLTVDLTSSRVKTLATANAKSGDVITITRTGGGAYTLTVNNGGPAFGTLFTLPSGEKWWCRAYFDGTNWLAHSAGALP